MKQNRFSKVRLGIVLSISVFTILTAQTFASYSGLLDNYSGTGFSDVGKISEDSFTINDNDFYTKTEITGSSRWPNANAGITLIPYKKGTFSYSAVSNKANSFTANQSTGAVSQSFTGLTSGTYKIFFKSQYQENGLCFEGSVYDNN